MSSIVVRVREAVANRTEAPAGPPEPSINLSPREHQILALLAEGYGSVNIAARLGLSHATIRNHVQHLLRRMDVHSQVEAVSLAFRRGCSGGTRMEATVGFEPTNEAFAEPSLNHLGTSPPKKAERGY